MATGMSNGVMLANNVNFSQTTETGEVTADGQLLIGASVAPYIRAATLTAGPGISVTNAAGSITLGASGGGFTWNYIAVNTPLVANNGYITNNAAGVTFTLPATAVVGDTFRVARRTGAWTIAQNALQRIYTGLLNTTTGVTGSLVSLQQGDAVEIVCIVDNTTFLVVSDKGNYTVN